MKGVYRPLKADLWEGNEVKELAGSEFQPCHEVLPGLPCRKHHRVTDSRACTPQVPHSQGASSLGDGLLEGGQNQGRNLMQFVIKPNYGQTVFAFKFWFSSHQDFSRTTFEQEIIVSLR